MIEKPATSEAVETKLSSAACSVCLVTLGARRKWTNFERKGRMRKVRKSEINPIGIKRCTRDNLTEDPSANSKSSNLSPSSTPDASRTCAERGIKSRQNACNLSHHLNYSAVNPQLVWSRAGWNRQQEGADVGSLGGVGGTERESIPDSNAERAEETAVARDVAWPRQRVVQLQSSLFR